MTGPGSGTLLMGQPDQRLWLLHQRTSVSGGLNGCLNTRRCVNKGHLTPVGQAGANVHSHVVTHGRPIDVCLIDEDKITTYTHSSLNILALIFNIINQYLLQLNKT